MAPHYLPKQAGDNSRVFVCGTVKLDENRKAEGEKRLFFSMMLRIESGGREQ